jgi:glutamine synthetase
MDSGRTTTAAEWTQGAKGEAVRQPRSQPVSEIFGRLTFNKKVMAERLPRAAYERLMNTIENNDPLDPQIADEVAQAMKDWAVSLGATHYCHWFQPLRGVTAEKHDSFINVERDGAAIESFSGKQLRQGEPDASSFPSGGMRSTFEARGYTAWDPTSPAYVLKTGRAATLVIPTLYISWTGEVLDRKTPLLRSLHALEERAIKVVRMFGHKTVRHVRVTLGPEQEYFLVSKEFYLKRPDLIYTGRTLLGTSSAKHQQMEDHYFGEIKPRVLNFMADVETALFERGIPAKTRHNEVAPNQFEIAVQYGEANLAIDQNLQVMEIMRKVADDHGLAILLHEKPFAGINGSGKHLNWSMADSEGRNLLEPGTDPKANVQFLVFLAAILEGVNKFGGLLRASVADAGNDHRLGANEAPPAIMSVYLGEFLSGLLDGIEKGAEGPGLMQAAVDHGLKKLPTLAKDTSDRNRTSPIAFTGNKFEFRAVGSSHNTSDPAAIWNLIVSYGLDQAIARVEKHAAKESDIAKAALSAVRELVKETKRVRFEGNGYSEEWHKEAKKRGLPAAQDTPAALQTLVDKDVVALFTKYNVLREHELHAVYEIKLEAYAKTKEIELKLLKEIAMTYVTPAVVRHVERFGEAVAALAAAKTKGRGKALVAPIQDCEKLLADLYKGVAAVDDTLASAAKTPDIVKKARVLADKGGAALAQLRTACDRAEELVEHRLWPLPKYREMLFLL